jgi:7-cyano-7-deazaguanine tRNA-ribosyltransferase
MSNRKSLQIVAGLSLRNLNPRVWDPESPYHLPELRAVMVSYADFNRNPAYERRAMASGLHAFLNAPAAIAIYLDNGAFAFMRREAETPRDAYAAFVAQAKPDWYPIHRDYIPAPMMTLAAQHACLARTMAVNRADASNGSVPVIHISRVLRDYVAALRADDDLMAKPALAIGGIVPNLLRAPKAMPYPEILRGLIATRATFADKALHVFGIGGTATIHLAAILGMDSVDSSGWRNRAARGIVQLPGSGDRMVADLGKWRGRVPSAAEWERLAACACPACQHFGLDGLRARGMAGFCNRAAHNLWVLLREAEEVGARLADGTYAGWYAEHLDNSTYLPLIRQALTQTAAPAPA